MTCSEKCSEMHTFVAPCEQTPHEHVYRCQDCGLTPEEVLDIARRPAPPPWPCPGWSGASDDGPWVWVRADDDWRIGGSDRRCRIPRCPSPAVLRLNRWQRRRGLVRPVPMWWHYCAKHSFGRVIYDGGIWQPGRPEDWDGSRTDSADDTEPASPLSDDNAHKQARPPIPTEQGDTP